MTPELDIEVVEEAPHTIQIDFALKNAPIQSKLQINEEFKATSHKKKRFT